MIPFIKSLVGIGSLVVGVGFISAPIAAYSNQSSTRVKRSLNSSSSGGARSDSVVSQTSQMSFDEMGQRIDEDFKKKNSDSSNSSLTSNLKTIVSNNSDSQKVWDIPNQNGEKCEFNQSHMHTPCGFLYLKTKDVEYKLGVSRDESGKGKIKIVKKDSRGVNYYDSETIGWKAKNDDNGNFEKLVAFNKQSEDSGNIYQQVGIIYPVQ